MFWYCFCWCDAPEPSNWFDEQISTEFQYRCVVLFYQTLATTYSIYRATSATTLTSLRWLFSGVLTEKTIVSSFLDVLFFIARILFSFIPLYLINAAFFFSFSDSFLFHSRIFTACVLFLTSTISSQYFRPMLHASCSCVRNSCEHSFSYRQDCGTYWPGRPHSTVSALYMCNLQCTMYILSQQRIYVS